MAKIRHNNIIDTVDELFTLAKMRGSLHLYANGEEASGRTITIGNREALHFGTCGYLSLEHHPSIKNGAIEAIQKYGTQFPMSKTYVSSPLYEELEVLIESMFGAPVVISKNCTLSHLAVLPTLVGNSDLLILDHQVHSSVQEVARKLLSRGISVEMIRHNNLEMLEEVIKKNRNNHDKIWYLADGVYSMYGDFAPIQDMITLAEKYEQLHLYVDDAHGMSWAGHNGTGYVMSQMNGLYRKMILTATMGKAFGACGGLTLFPDSEWQRKVKTFGGPNTFSVQLEPPILGAAVASAKIHLSNEIYEYQRDIEEKIKFCNELLSKTDLPLVACNNSPIFFIGSGTMAMGNAMVTNLLADGIYVNLAPYPAVPAKNIGIRVTISTNNTYEDIELLVDKLQSNFEKSLLETGQTEDKIRRAFKMELKPNTSQKRLIEKINDDSKRDRMKFKKYSSINQIDSKLWNDYLGHRGAYDWNALNMLESAFSGNSQKEHNWNFLYYIVEDENGTPILMTFFVIALYKEDMFARATISEAMEEQRKIDPYYFTSKSIIMGSLFTEGDHLYLDKSNELWKNALHVLFDDLYKVQEETHAKNIIFRDLSANDPNMHQFMMEQSFVKIDMPVTCISSDLNWQSTEEFLETLSKKNRRNYKQEFMRTEEHFDVEIRQSLSEEELDLAKKLFYQVKNKNIALNTFSFPDKIFQHMNDSSDWEFIILRLKSDYSVNNPVGVGFCHKNVDKVYGPTIVGLDYQYVYEFGVYRQMLNQVLLRAHNMNFKQINWGLSAAIEKKKVGATLYPKVAYFQAKDNYAAEMMAATIALEKD